MANTESSTNTTIIPALNVTNQLVDGPSNAGSSEPGPSFVSPPIPLIYRNQQTGFDDFIEVDDEDDEDDDDDDDDDDDEDEDEEDDDDEDDDDAISYPNSLQYSSSEEVGAVEMGKLQRRIEWCKNKIGISQEIQAKDGDEGTSRKRKKFKSKDNRGKAWRRKKFTKLYHSLSKNFSKLMDYNSKGYIFGFVLEDGETVYSNSSSFERWWKREVKFNDDGPSEAERYYRHQNPLAITPHDIENHPPKPIFEMLMKLSDGTVASLMSATMQQCDPPQRKFPLEKGVAPAWWPTERDDWWGPSGVPDDQPPPPYRKPHDLKKKSKVVVIIAIIKHISPNFSKLIHIVQHSRSLQDRMSSRENNTWNSVLKEEIKSYCRDNPDVPLSVVLSSFRGVQVGVNEDDVSSGRDSRERNNALRQRESSGGDERIQEEEGTITRNDRVIYVCIHPRCVYHDENHGFNSRRIRDEHQNYCVFLKSEMRASQFNLSFPGLQNPTTTEVREPSFPNLMAPNSTLSFPTSPIPAIAPQNPLPDFGGFQFPPVEPSSSAFSFSTMARTVPELDLPQYRPVTGPILEFGTQQFPSNYTFSMQPNPTIPEVGSSQLVMHGASYPPVPDIGSSQFTFPPQVGMNLGTLPLIDNFDQGGSINQFDNFNNEENQDGHIADDPLMDPNFLNHDFGGL